MTLRLRAAAPQKLLFLADWTVEGRTAGLGNACDRSAATRPRAGRSLRGRRRRRRAGNSRGRRRLDDGRARSSLPPRSLPRARRGWLWPARRPRGSERRERSRGLPPAETAKAGREKALRRRRCCPGQRCAFGRARRPSAARASRQPASPERAASNSRASGSSPRSDSRGCDFERVAADEIHEAEAPRIVVGDDLAVIEMQHDVIVLGVLRALAMECAGRPRRRGLDPERAGHARDGRSASRRRRAGTEGILRAAPGATIRRPVRRSRKRGGKGKRMSPRRSSTFCDACADHGRLESAPDGLDLRQFRHRHGPG